MNRKLRMGMIGGGTGAFIGEVHRTAAKMDGLIELVSGAFSSTKQRSIDSGLELGLSEDRVYSTYREMLRGEAKKPKKEKIDFVSIVTPNNMHYPIAMAALDAGFHIVCDKPMTTSIDEAVNLEKKVNDKKKIFCITYNYTGYPMVKEARRLVAEKELGSIRRVVVEYPQGWLSKRLEAVGQKQASWRTNPKNVGLSCCIGDIGSHCENLAHYIVGSPITEVCSDITTCINGRLLDDDGSVLIRFANEAKGILWASQVAIGEENGLNIRVYGSKGSLKWRQEEPNTLIVDREDKPREILRTGTPFVGETATAATRLPAGHPEGYLESFANTYKAFAEALMKEIDGEKLTKDDLDFPSVADGCRGMKFVSAVVISSTSKDKWVEVKK